MDSLTQITLGAAVGEAVLGRHVGRKAALWGAVGGLIPDLDILANPFVSEVQQLAIHRGFTHSLVFVVLMSPLAGWLLSRFHPDEGVSWRSWSALAFWAFLTHIALDCFTTYGTQIFQPFSNYPVSFNSIFIIDLLYSIPLAVGILGALVMDRSSPGHRWANYFGLTLSTGYLLLTVVNKQFADAAFTSSLRAQNIPYERMMTRPTPFNNVLWMGMADDGESLWIGLYSLLDDDRSIDFQRVDKRRRLLADKRDQLPVQRLLWFSRGYYTMTQQNGALVFHDLRFGRTDSWVTHYGDYLFNFRLRLDPENPSRVLGFRQQPPSLDFDRVPWRQFWIRIKGREIQRPSARR